MNISSLIVVILYLFLKLFKSFRTVSKVSGKMMQLVLAYACVKVTSSTINSFLVSSNSRIIRELDCLNPVFLTFLHKLALDWIFPFP